MNFKIERKGYSKAEVEQYIAQQKADYESRLKEQAEAIAGLKMSSQKLSEKIEQEAKRYDLISKSIISANEKAEEIERLTQVKYSSEVETLRSFHEKWKEYYNKILKAYPLDEQLQGVEQFNMSMQQILQGDDAILSDNQIVDDVYSLLESYNEEENNRINEKRIGYITVQTDHSEESEAELDDVQQEMAVDSPAFAEDFDPIGRIKRFLSLDKRTAKKDKKPSVKKEEKVASIKPEPISVSSDAVSDDYFSNSDFSDRSPSGFSFEEALNPTDDLEDIMRDLGLLNEEL